MISPLRILILYRQEGLVQTQALYSMEAPWLPKSESGTRSPSLHLRHRGNAFSTKSPPSLSLEDSIHLLYRIAKRSKQVSRGGASAAASASPQQVGIHAVAIIPQIASCVSYPDEEIFIILLPCAKHNRCFKLRQANMTRWVRFIFLHTPLLEPQGWKEDV